MTSGKKKGPGWREVKAAVSGFSQPGLIDLLHHLYQASNENRAFLHARFGLTEPAPASYKRLLKRWLSPNIHGDQGVSVSAANKLIADYRKSAGETAGLADLMIHYCELSTDFTTAYGYQERAYLNATVRMFAGAVKILAAMPEQERKPFLPRLNLVWAAGNECGYGVGDAMADLVAEYGLEEELDDELEDDGADMADGE